MKEKINSFLNVLKRIVIPPKNDTEKLLENITEEVLKQDDSTKKNVVIHALLLTNQRLWRLFLGVIGFSAIVITTLLIVCFLSMTSIKKVPLLWLVKDNGQILYMGESVRTMSDRELQQKMPAYYLGEFVKSAFSVSSDGAVMKQKQNKAFALTSGHASEWLRTYYTMNDPYKIAQKNTITVEVNYVYPNKKLQNYYTVGWTTTEMEAKTGDILKVQKYQGDFEFYWGDHVDNEVINEYNPMSFFISSISMAKDNSKKIF